ncbi:hypothetical protein SSP24_37520 [Streptomyces spinoverrucosus]|uniref:Uncharacterized protein n=1 Tax=Streptomyces spinoverrucosus TaxID=284043 RepID=A0A4Y3VGS9_9ACTN|nr:hypothetical protein SSP24_37520 [Streptomyces spinoverrucosus]GHB89919.1 hypothetical protein GCM10010397_72580 [Streptomyces spinoverrucosus]
MSGGPHARRHDRTGQGVERAQRRRTALPSLTMTTYGDLPVPYTEIPYQTQPALRDGGGPCNQT